MSEDGSLAGRVALVTGASGEIGAAIARQLGAAGASVAVAYGSNADGARCVADVIEAGGGHARVFGADLREAAAAGALAKAVATSLGPIDLLIANAGIVRAQQLEDVTADDFDETLAINLRAPFLLAQHVVPTMRARRFGRILFTSSVAAFTGGIVGPHYAASKAGLHGMVHFLARRLAAHGVTVNAIAPALIEDPGDFGPHCSSELREMIPVGRFGTSAEVADVALTMLRNGYLTSQIVGVDGGMYPR